MVIQKRMLLQLPEQRVAAEREIRTHRLVDHENVIKLVSAEIKDQRNGEGVALLVFPYYQVSQIAELTVGHTKLFRVYSLPTIPQIPILHTL